MPEDFDLIALHAALEAQRTARGLSWAAVGKELGVSPATLRSFGERRSAEERLPETSARTLRFDARALDAERTARGLTWRGTAAASGAGSGAALTRLHSGGRVTFPEVMRVLAWLGQPAARFVRVSRG